MIIFNKQIYATPFGVDGFDWFCYRYLNPSGSAIATGYAIHKGIQCLLHSICKSTMKIPKGFPIYRAAFVNTQY